MKRRDFLSWVGVGALAASLPVALAACNAGGQPGDKTDQSTPADGSPQPSAPKTAETTSEENHFTSVGTVNTLDEQGFVADENFSAGSVIVIRNPDDPSTLIAISSVCPHRGCTVEWHQADQQFVCPCHRSSFQPDGSLVSGPATRSLDHYEVKIEGDQVMVKGA